MKHKILYILLFLAALFSCGPEPVPVGGIFLNTSSLTLDIGNCTQLSATIIPSTADNKLVHWKSSSDDIAVVDSDGKVTAVATGKAEISAIADEGGGAFIATCYVTVPQVVFPVQSLSIDPKELVLTKGAEEKVTATILPENATYTDLNWFSTNENVVSVKPGEGGTVATATLSAVGTGTASVVVTSLDGGYTAECKVTVEQHVSSLSLSQETIEFELNDFKPVQLIATILPEDAEDKTVQWSSSNENVAKVAGGLVSAVGIGEAVIKAQTRDGSLEKTCKVTVKCKVTGVKLSEHKATLKVGDTEQLVAEVIPANAGNKSITWTSSNPSVATVSKEGLVTALASGSAEVSVTTADGDFSEKCVVTVEKDATGLSLNETILLMVVEETAQLVATVEPSGVTNGKVRWSSTDKNVASVSDNGLVTANNAGEAFICATSQDGGYHAQCAVKVRNKVDKITVTGDASSLYIGKTLKLRYSITPADAANVDIVWSSEDPSKATVNTNGVVTGVAKAESVKIYASTSDGRVKGYYPVKVMKAVTSITASRNAVALYEGDTESLTVSVAPTDATETGYTVESVSESGGAASFANGKITATKPGVVTFTFKPKDQAGLSAGLSASCKVTIWEHVTGVSIRGEGTEKYLALGDTFRLIADVTPSTAYNKVVKWTTSNPDVVSIESSSGTNVTIKAKAQGDAELTVTTDDRKLTASCTVHVRPKATSITLSDSTKDLYTGDTYKLVATVLPTNANDLTVSWKSDKTSVAEVSADGTVTAKSAGTAVITATSNSNTALTATCTVTVTKKTIHVQTVSLSKDYLELVQGNSEALVATVLPSNADNKSVTWKSSNSLVASVDANGRVTASGQGTAVITATSVDNSNAKATCNVKVLPPPVSVESVTLSESSIYLQYNKSHTLVATILPEDASNKNVVWSSSNESIATVSQAGVVTAKSVAGTVIITAASEADQDIKATCTVTVKSKVVPVTGLSINPSSMSIYINQTKKINVTVSPSNADDKSVQFQADRSACVRVDAEGNVTGQKDGVCLVLVTTNDGGYEKNCSVTVTTNNVVRIKITGPDGKVIDASKGVVLRQGEVLALVGEGIGADSSVKASFPGVEWSNKSDGIVSVTSAGRITANKVGQTTITVSSVERYSTVSVNLPVTVIASDPSSGGTEGSEFDDWNF